MCDSPVGRHPAGHRPPSARCHIPAARRVNLATMDENLAAQFEANRRRLQSVAYRMLGSLTEAEDAVQETWMRLSRSDPDSIDNLGGWLTTVLSRVCLGVLRSRRSRPEEPMVGDEPEPELGRPGGRGAPRRHAGPGSADRAR